MLTAMLALLGAFPENAAPPAGSSPQALARRARAPDYVIRIPLPAARELELPGVAGPSDRALPLVVLDPGHGGIDLGRIGREGEEKALALDLARAVRHELVRRGRVRVALTREGDRLLTLPERSAVARRLGADLFISLHAGGGLGSPPGAAVYTLAERPSDPEAEGFAARENAADSRLGAATQQGIAAAAAGAGGLSPRQVADRSAVFARLVVRDGARGVRFAPRPRRAAALAVLRPLGIPSVLIDVGPLGAAGPGGARAGFAQGVARAVETYFSRLPPERRS